MVGEPLLKSEVFPFEVSSIKSCIVPSDITPAGRAVGRGDVTARRVFHEIRRFSGAGIHRVMEVGLLSCRREAALSASQTQQCLPIRLTLPRQFDFMARSRVQRERAAQSESPLFAPILLLSTYAVNNF